MKLSIVCSESRLNSLPGLREVFDGLFVESRAWYVRPELSSMESLENLEQCLDFSSYVLCILNTEDFNSTWLHYTLGHQRGHTDHLTFWVMPEDSRLVPEWTSGFIVIPGSHKDVYDYYAEVEESWGEEE